MPPKRLLLIAAEDTEAAANACQWAVDKVYRDGDEFQLVYVVRSLMPPMEVFHGMPGTAYSFKQPGEHKEWGEIEEAKEALEARYLPVLQQKMVPYTLQLYAERTDATASRVGELLLKRADEVDATMVIMAAHNKPSASTGFAGSVAQYITSNCHRPLALVRPKEAEWEHVEHGEAPPAEELEALQQHQHQQPEGEEDGTHAHSS